MAIFQKLKIELLNPEAPILGMSKVIESGVWKKYLILTFTAILSTITQNWKQPRYPLTDNEQKNVMYTLLLLLLTH